jgi:transcriptional regulator
MREAHGLTQSDVARRMGTQTPNISVIERRPFVRFETVQRYVRALGGQLECVVYFPDKEPVALDVGGDYEDAEP